MIEPSANDPTGTRQIISKFETEMERRWDRVERDARRSFNQLTGPSAERQAQFDYDLEKSMEEHIVEPMSPYEVLNGQHYTGVFIREAYSQGIELAEYYLQEALDRFNATDDVMSEGQHSDTLSGQYEQMVLDMANAANETQRDMSLVYREALGKHKPPRLDPVRRYRRRVPTPIISVIDQNQLWRRIQKKGLRMARAAIAYQVVETTNKAALVRYEDFNLDQVGIDIEMDTDVQIQDIPDTDLTEAEWERDWVTAGDDRVCLECWGLAANGPYEISEIRDGMMPPQHVNCRCFIVPNPSRLRPGTGRQLS